MYKLTLTTAKKLLEIAEQRARQMGLNSDIAIVDEGTNLMAFYRMDNAKIAGIDIAIGKAWTSVALQMPTANLAQSALPGGATFGINTTNQGKVVILGGGIPLVHEGRIVGGIGVSGGTSTQDIDVANAAVQAFENMRSNDIQYANARIGTVNQSFTY
ncbi:heme-binding protein [Paenibacillus lautus]|uniref:GlcG/HbpS family heme-binding protein n=1 Tax=Paenibacillus lautus TaxID=1401 RepID=UPI003D2DD0C1